MEKRTVMVIGASGKVGTATVTALSAMHDPETTVILAGVRNVGKAEALKELPGVEVVQAQMGDAKLATTLIGVDSLFIVCPSTTDCAPIVLKTMKSAKAAGVKHVMAVSVMTAGRDSIYGRQFGFIEAGIKLLRFEYTILRLPIFMENFYLVRDGIASESSIYMPVDPSKPYVPVVAAEAGKMAAKIMLNPHPHNGKTYSVTAPAHTLGEAAAAFSAALGKEVSYVQIPYETAVQAYMEGGFEKWQVEGVVELYHDIDNGDSIATTYSPDYENVMGAPQTDLYTWVKAAAPDFA
uniref:NmrA-like domain-containing protein n=1 Tax=Rhodosorus marinus TaxID=101924 RepID=A0A7S3EC65_9RHOD|mmetsp:Transcript_22004/g.89337  ORF Transcript_22004/g.89337 Transcript_22004/m.89337 type:complete len:294 (+) Transcript_22004:144-1025(+)